MPFGLSHFMFEVLLGWDISREVHMDKFSTSFVACVFEASSIPKNWFDCRPQTIELRKEVADCFNRSTYITLLTLARFSEHDWWCLEFMLGIWQIFHNLPNSVTAIVGQRCPKRPNFLLQKAYTSFLRERFQAKMACIPDAQARFGLIHFGVKRFI